MGIRSLFGFAAASLVVMPALQSIPARADGPKSAYDDGGTVASSQDPSKHQPKQVAQYNVPPLPPGMSDEAFRSMAPPSHVARRPLPPPSGYQAAMQEPQYAPPPLSYQPPPVYAQAPALDSGPAMYQEPVYVQQGYAPPPPPAVQYVPVYAADADAQDYPPQAVVQPVVAVVGRVPYPVYQEGDSEGTFPVPYRDGPMIYHVGQ